MAQLVVASATVADGTFSALGTTVWNAGMSPSSGVLTAAFGGTNSAFFQVAGPSVARNFTFPDADATIARTDAANTFTGVQTFNTPIASSSVAAMTATVGGGVPTPPNNTTTFLRGDATFSTVAGRFLARTVITSGVTFTTGANTNKVTFWGKAGGGGGGGVLTGAVTSAAGSGGSEGGEFEWTIAVTPSTAYTIAIGALGAGGAAGNNNGVAGGNTTVTVGATTVTAFGGLGGTGQAATAGLADVAGAASPAISTNGDANYGGALGGNSYRLSVTVILSGDGGGRGAGKGRSTQGDGAAAISFGAAGAGACTINGGASQAGGNGFAGVLIATEYS